MKAHVWLALLLASVALAIEALLAAALADEVRERLLVRATAALQDEGSNYRSPDSSTLAWGESYLLDAYVWMYRATGDRSWLDRLVRHTDAMMANATPGADGGLGWRTDRYSVALVKLQPRGQVGSDLHPDEERVLDIERAHRVTGHRYRLVCRRPAELQVIDLSAYRELPRVVCTTEKDFEVAPGVELRCDRLPQPGESWTLLTTSPRPLEYVVHDGMILQPIAHFVRLVRERPHELADFAPAAARYLDLMERELLPKWDRWWRDFPEGGGAYLAQDDPSQRFPGIVLPHNQYLALGRVMVALYRVTGKDYYRTRAERMATFFRQNLRREGDHYLWNYWDPARPQDEPGKRMQVVEDSSHGHIDVGFMADCAEAGIVFTAADLALLRGTLAATLQSDRDPPLMGSRIGSREGDYDVMLDWARLAPGNPALEQAVVRFGLGRTLGGHQAGAIAQLLALTLPRASVELPR